MGGIDFQTEPGNSFRGLQLKAGGVDTMNSEEFKSLQGLPRNPDRTVPGFRQRFALKLRRSLNHWKS